MAGGPRIPTLPASERRRKNPDAWWFQPKADRPTQVVRGQITPGMKPPATSTPAGVSFQPPYKPDFPEERLPDIPKHFSEGKGVYEIFWNPNRIYTYKKVLDMNPGSENRPNWLTDDVADQVHMAYDLMEWRARVKGDSRTNIPMWSMPDKEHEKEFNEFLQDIPRPATDKEIAEYNAAILDPDPRSLDFLPKAGDDEWKTLSLRQKFMVQTQRVMVGIAGDPVKLGAAIGLAAGAGGFLQSGAVSGGFVGLREAAQATGQGALFGAGMQKYEKFATAMMWLDAAWQAVLRPAGMVTQPLHIIAKGLYGGEQQHGETIADNLAWYLKHLPEAWKASQFLFQASAPIGTVNTLGAIAGVPIDENAPLLGENLSWDTPWYKGEYNEPRALYAEALLEISQDYADIKEGIIPDHIAGFVSEHFEDGIDRIEDGDVSKDDVYLFWVNEFGLGGLAMELFGGIFLDPLNWAFAPAALMGDSLTAMLKLAPHNLDANSMAASIKAVANGSNKWTAVPDMYAKFRLMAHEADPAAAARLTQSGYEGVSIIDIYNKGEVPIPDYEMFDVGKAINLETGKVDTGYDYVKTNELVNHYAANVAKISEQEGAIGAINRMLTGITEEGTLKILEPVKPPSTTQQVIGGAAAGGLLGGLGSLIAGVPGMAVAGLYGLWKGWEKGINGLGSLTPKSRAALATSKAGNLLAMGMEYARFNGDLSLGPDRALNYLHRIAESPMDFARETSIYAMGGPEGAVIPNILTTEVIKDADAMHTRWMRTEPVRKMMDDFSKALDMEYDDLLMGLKDPTKADEIFAQLENLIDTDPDAIKGVAEKLANHEMTVEKLTETAQKMTDGTIFNNSKEFFDNMYLLLLDKTNKWATEWYGVGPKALEHQFVGAVKAVQTLVLLSANPNFAIKNIIDNQLTIAFDGYGKIRSQTEIDNLWADQVGFIPVRLRAGVGPAGIGGIELGQSMKHITKAEQAPGVLNDTANAVYGLNKKVGFATKISAEAEAYASAQVMTNAFLEFYNAANKPGMGFDDMPAPLQSKLKALHGDMYDDIMAHIMGSMNNLQIMDALNIGMTRHSFDKVLNDVSGMSGQDPSLVRAGMRQLHIYDDLKGKLRVAESIDDVRTVYNDTILEVYDGIIKNLEEEMVGYEDYVAGIVAPDAEGYVGAWSFLNDNAYESLGLQLLGYRENDAMFLRRLEGDDVAAFKRERVEQRLLQQKRYDVYHLREQAMLLGITKGLDPARRIDVWKLADKKNKGWQNFWETEKRLSDEYWTNRGGMDEVTSAAAWKAMQEEITGLYTSTVSEESYVMRKVDDHLADLIGEVHGEEIGEIARAGMLDIRDQRDVAGQEMTAFRDTLEGVTDYRERYEAWSGEIERIKADSIHKMNTHAAWVDDVNHLINGGDPENMPSAALGEKPVREPQITQHEMDNLVQKSIDGEYLSPSEVDQMQNKEYLQMREEMTPLAERAPDIDWDISRVEKMTPEQRRQMPIDEWHPIVAEDIKSRASLMLQELEGGEVKDIPIQDISRDMLERLPGLSEDQYTELSHYVEGTDAYKAGTGSELVDRTYQVSTYPDWYRNLTNASREGLNIGKEQIINALKRIAEGDKKATKPPEKWTTQNYITDIVYESLVNGTDQLPPNLMFGMLMGGLEPTIESFFKFLEGQERNKDVPFEYARAQLEDISPELSLFFLEKFAEREHLEATGEAWAVTNARRNLSKRQVLNENQKAALDNQPENPKYHFRVTSDQGTLYLGHLLDSVNVYNKYDIVDGNLVKVDGTVYRRLEDVPTDVARKSFEVRKFVKDYKLDITDDNFGGKIIDTLESERQVDQARADISEGVSNKAEKLLIDSKYHVEDVPIYLLENKEFSAMITPAGEFVAARGIEAHYLFEEIAESKTIFYQGTNYLRITRDNTGRVYIDIPDPSYGGLNKSQRDLVYLLSDVSEGELTLSAYITGEYKELRGDKAVKFVNDLSIGPEFEIQPDTYETSNPNIVFKVDGEVREIPKDSPATGAAGLVEPGGVEQSLGLRMDYMRGKEQAMIEEYIPMLQEMKRQHTSESAQYPGDIAGRTVDPVTAKELQQYLNQVNGQQSSLKLLGADYAEKRRDFGLHNYSMEYGWDELASLGMPYHLWYSRAIIKWGIRLMSNPAYLARYAKLKKRREIAAPSNYPTRLEGKIRIPAPWLPDQMGDSIFFDPFKALYPVAQLTYGLWDKPANENRQFERQVYYALENMVAMEEISEEQFASAVSGNDPEIMNEAVREAELRVQENSGHPFEFIEGVFGFHIPLDLIKRAREGTLNETGLLPLTRFIKNITSLGKPGGVNIEAPIRKAFGGDPDGMLGDFYIVRELGNMVADGVMTASDMRELAVMASSGNRDHPLLKEAQSRVDDYQRLRYIGQVLGVDVMPSGEAKLRVIGEEFFAAIEAGDTNKFFEKYPEYEARLLLSNWDDPEEMAKAAMKNQIWESYMDSDPAIKKAARERFGEEFSTGFLQENNIEVLTLEKMALWSQLLSGEDFEILKGDAADESPLLDVATMTAYEEFKGQTEARGVDLARIQQLQQIYYDLPEVEKASFLGEFTELQDYWNWKNVYLGTHPELVDVLGTKKVREMPEDIQPLYIDYQAKMMQYFGPEIYDTQSGYFDLPEVILSKKDWKKGVQTPRQIYLQQHPELRQYWDWKREIKELFPQLEPYLTKQPDAIPIPKEVQGVEGPHMLDISDWDADLLQTLSVYFYSGRELGAGSLAMLKSKWIENGKPGELQDFIDTTVRNSFEIY